MAKRARNPDVPEVREIFALRSCHATQHASKSVCNLQISEATRLAFKAELAEKVCQGRALLVLLDYLSLEPAMASQHDLLCCP